MAKHFPSDFYVTCATVIPVLYLAVALQGKTWDSFMQSAWAAVQGRPRGEPKYRLTPIRGIGVVVAATYIMLAGGVGEAFALLALYRGSDVPTERTIVLGATLLLVFVVVAIPVLPQGNKGETPDDHDRGSGEAAKSSKL